jgi:hypothetical protein
VKDSPFSSPVLALLLSAAAALFALSVLLPVSDEGTVPSGARAMQNSYSVSAVGYAGFHDLLRRLGLPVARGRVNAAALAGEDGLLVVAEPDPERLEDMEHIRFLDAPRLLLVLPKWKVRPDPAWPAWIAAAEPLLPEDALAVLSLVAYGDNEVFHRQWPAAWRMNALGVTPKGSGPVQLMRSAALRPLVGLGDAMLLGEVRARDRKIWVLSDPDILANHGILKGDNARFAFALIDALGDRREDRGRIVFDETVHGFQEVPGSPLKLLFRFPFVVVTLLACCAAVLLLLAGTGRFGAPLEPRRERDFGKAGLIDNTAQLLDYAGHHAVVLQRYVRMTIRSAAQALHAPSGLDGPDLAVWLDRVGKERGIGISCAAVLHAATFTAGESRGLIRLFADVRAIHRWKGEILNGSAERRRPG